jgi:hypothetical protein
MERFISLGVSSSILVFAIVETVFVLKKIKSVLPLDRIVIQMIVYFMIIFTVRFICALLEVIFYSINQLASVYLI